MENQTTGELKWQFNLEKAQQKGKEVALKDPLGYKCATNDVIVRGANSKNTNMTYVEILEAKAWGFAKSPAGSIMQTMLMFWFSGSGVSIFTLMITMQFLTNPIKAISSIQTSFAPFEHKDINLLLPKLAYLGLNLMLFCFALYKFSVMGVIPVTTYDWQGIISTRVPKETNQVLL